MLQVTPCKPAFITMLMEFIAHADRTGEHLLDECINTYCTWIAKTNKTGHLHSCFVDILLCTNDVPHL